MKQQKRCSNSRKVLDGEMHDHMHTHLMALQGCVETLVSSVFIRCASILSSCRELNAWRAVLTRKELMISCSQLKDEHATAACPGVEWRPLEPSAVRERGLNAFLHSLPAAASRSSARRPLPQRCGRRHERRRGAPSHLCVARAAGGWKNKNGPPLVFYLIPVAPPLVRARRASSTGTLVASASRFV